MEGPATQLDAATSAFLESGCALIIATVMPDGAPYATRGWGLTLLPGDDLTARLLLAADDAPALTQLADRGRVAITGADVRTLRSVQLKGWCISVEAADDQDRARYGRYKDAFFGDVAEIDRYPRRVIERTTPVDVAACVVAVDELYDQTPGPGAGAAIDSTAS